MENYNGREGRKNNREKVVVWKGMFKEGKREESYQLPTLLLITVN